MPIDMDALNAQIAALSAGTSEEAKVAEPEPDPEPTTVVETSNTSGGKASGSKATNTRKVESEAATKTPYVVSDDVDMTQPTVPAAPTREPSELDILLNKYTGDVQDYTDSTKGLQKKVGRYISAVESDPGHLESLALRERAIDDLNPSYLYSRRQPGFGSADSILAPYQNLADRKLLRGVAINKRPVADTHDFLQETEKDYKSADMRNQQQLERAHARTKALILISGDPEKGAKPNVSALPRLLADYRLGLTPQSSDLAEEFRGDAEALKELNAAFDTLTKADRYDIERASRVYPFGV